MNKYYAWTLLINSHKDSKTQRFHKIRSKVIGPYIRVFSSFIFCVLVTTAFVLLFWKRILYQKQKNSH